MPLFTSPNWANTKRVNAKLAEVLQIVENPDRFEEGATKLANWVGTNPENLPRVKAALKRKGSVQADALLNVLPRTTNVQQTLTKTQRNNLRNAAEPMSLRNFLKSRKRRSTRRRRGRTYRKKN